MKVRRCYGCMQEFADEFANALNLADKAFVMDINYDRENPEDYPGINAYTIIDKLEKVIKLIKSINKDKEWLINKLKDEGYNNEKNIFLCLTNRLLYGIIIL